MKKVLSLLMAALLALIPFSGAMAATGTLTATVTVPNAAATTIVFPDLAGGTASTSAATTSGHFDAAASSTSDLSLSIGSTTIALTAGMTAAQAAQATVDAINADGSNQYSASTTNTDEITLTAKAAGTAGNGPVAASDLSYNGTAEVATFVPASVTAGETYRVTVNGTNYDYVALSGDTAADVAAALAAMIDANAAVSCSASGDTITCTSSVAGTAFASAATVLDASSGGSSSGLNPVTISSNNSNTSCAKPGDVVTLTFTSSSALGTSTTATIDGYTTHVISLGSDMYAASTTLNASTTEGVLAFHIDPFDTLGNAGTTTASTTDNSMVTFDMTAPAITLNGNSTLNLTAGSNFSLNDPGATTTDASGATITNDAATSLNTQTPGTYTVTYTAADCAGNTASTTRTVVVAAAPLQGGHRQDVSNLFGTVLPPLGSGSASIALQNNPALAYILDAITIGPRAPFIPNTGVDETFVFTRDLSVGMRGDDVIELQSRLTETGLYHAPVTGYFGPATRAAVMRLQRGNNLSATGVFDAETRAVLNGD